MNTVNTNFIGKESLNVLENTIFYYIDDKKIHQKRKQHQSLLCTRKTPKN